MALDLNIESLDGLDDGVKGLYAKNQDTGRFDLQLNDSVSPKAKVDEFRSKNIDLMKKNDDLTNKYQNIDLDEYATLKSEAQKNKEMKLLNEGKRYI